MPKYLIEGSNDGDMFAEAIEAATQQEAEALAIDRLCEAWGVTREAETGLYDLGDCANVTEYSAEDYARDAAADMLAFVDQIARLSTTDEGAAEGIDDLGNDEAMNDLIEKARKIAAAARGEA